MWNSICSRFHTTLDKNQIYSQAYFSLWSEDAFQNDIFAELRWDKNRNLPILLHSTMGLRQLYKILLEKAKEVGIKQFSDVLQYIDWRYFLRAQYISKAQFEFIQTKLYDLEGVELASKSFGRDGNWVTAQSYIGKGAVFKYWGEPPAGYSALEAIVSLLAEYLPKTDRDILQTPKGVELAKAFFLKEETEQQRRTEALAAELAAYFG
mgnify:CR=1 FL=1|jgi:hypothetical protein